MAVFLKVYDFSSSGVGRPSANAAGGGGERGQCCDEADGHGGDPPAFSDALEHGNPFVELYVTIKYLHAEFEESVAQHCQTGTQFPQQGCFGKRIPEYRLRAGYAFPNRAQPETATQFEASKRDAVSA